MYDDRKDTVVRELDGKREELDGVAARLVSRRAYVQYSWLVPCNRSIFLDLSKPLKGPLDCHRLCSRRRKRSTLRAV